MRTTQYSHITIIFTKLMYVYMVMKIAEENIMTCNKFKTMEI